MPVFVDANCFKGYFDAFVEEREDAYSNAFSLIKENGWIVLDRGGLFEQEWRSCTGGPDNIAAGDLIGDMLAQDIIRIIEFKKDSAVGKSLRLEGLNAKDRRIVEFAVSCGLYSVVSHDVDLFEPKSKGCNAKKRHKIVHERKGKFCKLAQKKYGIIITCCLNFPDFVMNERLMAT
ncbi:MAG: hypothetical protein EOS12_18570 [Mesorhizobium sp.]|nr:MAG: hypothetical protein EOS12_18570 [Mesorhizobium sp.]